MKKKVTLILMVFLMFVVSSCGYRRDIPRDQGQQQRPQVDENRPDRLTKSEKDAVEENINGYNLEDDLRMTEMTEEEENRIGFLTQQEKMEFIKNLESKSMNTVLEEFNTMLPETITNEVQYFKQPITYDYLLITAEGGTVINENPTDGDISIGETENLDKLALLQRVEGGEFQGSNIWYRVAFESNGELRDGYIHSSLGTPRSFQFDKMQDAINELNQQLVEGELHFISNYKNENGTPPQEGDAAVDEYGYRVYHSAPAYITADINSDYRYVPDGMLVRILDEQEDFYHVDIPTFGGEFFVPKQFIDPEVTLSQLNHVVVIDRTQQNQASFEVGEGGLNLISYTLSTTGIPGDFSFETTLGMFKAIVKRDRFEYLQNGTQEIAGYAPFAIRFTGGAYIHGVPVAYEEEDGEKVDPGFIEYLHTIGTFPRSNMCVRNFTSHAEFLYNWMDIENGAVIVIE
ncbi:L,D-transpeptidase [Alkaliphilus transvaalensis]|uniref:L,D-transpeptidase n=1 Tax=Alkaliphilus transvaalensis TaxID=114628 RepID=UPI000479CDC9|nr:L,D-transpeptidase [Alkaliphilus transvaalensis]